MQAILIATGEENKLLPLTADMPSPMIPIVDRPAMVYAVELLARAGIRDITVSLYEQANRIESYFGQGERWNVQLQYLLQRQACGSAGALKRAEQLLTETFIVLPADAIIDFDIKAALQFHRAHGGVATAILVPATTDQPRTAQPAAIDKSGRLQPVDSASGKNADYVHTGAFIFEPAVLNCIPGKTSIDCQTQLMAIVGQAGQAVYGYVMDGYWNSLTTFSDFQDAQSTVLASLTRRLGTTQAARIYHPYVEAGELQPGIWVGQNSIIHPSARLTPPLFIGSGCRIGRDAELGPETIIGSGVVLDEGVTIQQSTVLSHTYVGQFLHLAKRIAHHTDLIDVETGINVQIADPWLLTAVNPALPGNLVRHITERLLALCGLILSAPLLLLISLTIWLTSGGPILTRVQRFGQIPMVKTNPQLITLYQFRTRKRSNAYTLLGKYLEFWEFNRLPELWNVVCGEMGLVGVKPLSLEEMLSFHQPWQQGRGGAQAGFTGLWYTQAMPTTDADELCILDAYQATMHTWRNDFRQMLATPGAWVKRRSQRQEPYYRSQNQQHRQATGVPMLYSEQENKQMIATTYHEQPALLLFSPLDRS